MKVYRWVGEIEKPIVILKDDDSNIEYQHQAGGILCSHPRVMGYISELNYGEEAHEAFLKIQEEYLEIINFNDDQLEELRSILGSIGFELDEENLDKTEEAWIHAIDSFGNKCVIAYQNSD